MIFGERFDKAINPEARLSAAFLIAANLVPLIGVVYWEWSVYEVVLLYWAENVIIGGINVFRIALTKSDTGFRGKLGLIPFFIIHYGLFCSIHGLFVADSFGEQGEGSKWIPSLLGETLNLTGWAFWALVASHVFSFFWNFIGKGEYKTANLIVQMFAPYGRIVVLHVAILIGAFIAEFYESPIWMLVILVLGKIVMDLALHFASHLKALETAE